MRLMIMSLFYQVTARRATTTVGVESRVVIQVVCYWGRLETYMHENRAWPAGLSSTRSNKDQSSSRGLGSMRRAVRS